VRFAVDAQGDGRVSLPALPRDGQQVLVTSEKGGDARAPTRTPILRVSA
jgi:hypothetical protein